jgi:hypothetical protein
MLRMIYRPGPYEGAGDNIGPENFEGINSKF